VPWHADAVPPTVRDANARRFTVVSFHAHPDDEVLFTGGTLARAGAEGHRVVLVVATDGEAGLADDSLLDDLGARRDAELDASARALGCARVVRLGYADSGWKGSARPGGFSEVDVDLAAGRLAEVLREESAELLTVYDAAGGYGHPDHVQVHQVGIRAAAMAGTPVVLEATVDRRLIGWGVRIASWVPGFDIAPADFRDAYSATDEITHRVDVRAYCEAKRAAMRAHVSQAGGGVRTLRLLTRLPGPLFRLALGHEWFVERGRPAGHRTDDIFETVRARLRG
jgi:LmbE family N-acetylglucosaminyl deacetylase